MNPPGRKELTPTRSKWEVAAWWVWGLMMVIVAARIAFAADPARNNVYLKVFDPAARGFLAGRDLYDPTSGFRYPPVAAALFVPFAWCGPVLGSVLWRVFNVGMLLAGVRAARRAGFPAALSSRERGVFLILLAVACQTSINNGQANPLVLGALLLATVGIVGRRTLAASVTTGLATGIKVYPVAYGCVLAVLKPRLWWGLLVAVAVTFALPFAFQDPDYVLRQYQALYELLRGEDRTDDLANAYRDLRLLAAAVGVPVPDLLFTALQVTTGLSIAVLVWSLKRARVDWHRVAALAFSLTMCWFMLFGPATEKSTYMLIGPTTAWSLLLAWRERRRAASVTWGVVNLLVIAEHTGLFASRKLQAMHPLSRCPLPAAALLALAALVGEMVVDWRSGRMQGPHVGGGTA